MCPHRPPPFKCKGDGPAVPSPGPKIDDLVTSTRPTIKTVISEATGLGKTAYTKCIGLTGELPKFTQGTAVSACKQAAETVVDQAKAGCNTAAEAGVTKAGELCQDTATQLAGPSAFFCILKHATCT